MNREAGPAGYDREGFAVLRGVIEPAVVELLTIYLAMRYRSGHMSSDAQVRGSAVIYGDPLFDTVLAQLVPSVSEATAIDLLPTYSFVRIYHSGEDLMQHTDRPSCEHSVTVHLAASDPDPWPIWLRGRDNHSVAVELGRGDAVAYRGCDLEHWRGPCPTRWYAQAFLHYVDRNGPHAELVYDRRRYLGEPAADNGAPI